ncbi:MAG: hypothetical protein ACREVG_17430 [Burkholderiales bacterium]
MKATLARCLSGLGVAALLIAGEASAAEVHVMISAGFYGVYSELGPAFERASGHRLVTTRGPSMGDSPGVNSRNVAALALYERMDFIQYGCERGFMLLDGELHDEIQMAWYAQSAI